jgi:Domain of unknown function (DUF5658)
VPALGASLRSRVIKDTAPAVPAASADRRSRNFYGLLIGSWKRRRRIPSEPGDTNIAAVDWHASHWLAAAIAVMLLSVADALFTLQLIRHGATEANPFMAPLVLGNGKSFAYWKLGLTGIGVIILVAFARVRLFGLIPAGVILYMAAMGYVALIVYEWRALAHLSGEVVPN